MEAPEKIYVSTDPFGFLHAYDCENHPPVVEEYVRKDAFIEKFEKWLRESVTNNPERNRVLSKKGVITIGGLIEDFREYVKGE